MGQCRWIAVEMDYVYKGPDLLVVETTGNAAALHRLYPFHANAQASTAGTSDGACSIRRQQTGEDMTSLTSISPRRSMRIGRDRGKPLVRTGMTRTISCSNQKSKK